MDINADHQQFANPVSVKSPIGCSFYIDSRQSLSEKTISKIVSSCKQINGSIYILRSQLTKIRISWNGLLPEANEDLKIYNKTWRLHLQQLLKIRKTILSKHPLVLVYFQPDIKRMEYWSQLTCSVESLRTSALFDEVLNWAKFHDFPIIVTPVSYSDDMEYGEWVSLMRGMSNLYANLSTPQEKDYQQQRSLTSVWKSYLKQPNILTAYRCYDECKDRV